MKRLVCVFAHPDDESFGPSGTIHLYAKTHEVHIICITNGDAGENHHKRTKPDLATIRQKELRASAKFLGVKKVHFLNYQDGTLNNAQYHEIAEKIKHITDYLKPEILLTFEPRGISGHIDHIAASMITSYVFGKVPYAKTLMYYCLPSELSQLFGEYFVYRPPGYKQEEIDKVVDISTARDTKTKAMLFHKSQMHDAQRLLTLFGTVTKEYFLVRKK